MTQGVIERRVGDGGSLAIRTIQSVHTEKRSDKDLVTAYVSGDDSAFAAILTRHQRQLWFAARRYGRTEVDAQDIFQEAVFSASRSMHRYRAEAALGTWLHRLVLNSGFDHSRHRSRRELPVLDETPGGAGTDLRLAHDPLAYLDIALSIRQALNKLPADRRTAILLVDLGGYSIDDVAAFEGVRPGTIKSRRARGKEELKVLLQEDFFPSSEN